MEPRPATYSPVVDPRDPTSVPGGLVANDELHVPLTPRRGSLRTPSWLRQIVERHRAIASFCTSDHQLLRWEEKVGSAERAVASLHPWGALTLDVPFYEFMSPAQSERALARSLGAITRGVAVWDRLGIRAIPLIKGLRGRDWEPQLRLSSELGLRRVALYGREQRLEGDEESLRLFVKAARLHGLRALLVGCFAKLDGFDRVDTAALHHYVLARRGRFLDRAGRAQVVGPDSYSDLLGRFLSKRRVPDLVEHNFRRARSLLAPPAPLSRFGFEMT